MFYTDDGLDDWGKMLCRRREGKAAVDHEACMQAYYGKQKREHAVADTPNIEYSIYIGKISRTKSKST